MGDADAEEILDKILRVLNEMNDAHFQLQKDVSGHSLLHAKHDQEISEIRAIQKEGEERLNALIALVDDMVRGRKSQ